MKLESALEKAVRTTLFFIIHYALQCGPSPTTFVDKSGTDFEEIIKICWT